MSAHKPEPVRSALKVLERCAASQAELLATLKSLQDWGEKYGGLGEWPKAEIRAAIKKAEGES
jgi:hypothetical protein